MYNAFGFGALNFFWIIYGVLLIAMNLTALDCTSAIAAFMAVDRECTDLEAFFNSMWAWTLIGWATTMISLAILPQMSAQASASNSVTMPMLTALWCVCMCVIAIVMLSTSVDGRRIPWFAIAVDLGPVPLAILAGFVHREPSTGLPLF